jgi:hypothetical protein
VTAPAKEEEEPKAKIIIVDHWKQLARASDDQDDFHRKAAKREHQERSQNEYHETPEDHITDRIHSLT